MSGIMVWTPDMYFCPPPPSDLTWKCIRLVYFQINITNNGFLFLQGVFLNFLVNYGFLRSVFYILNLSWKSLTLFSDFPNVFSIFGMESRPSFEWKKKREHYLPLLCKVLFLLKRKIKVLKIYPMNDEDIRDAGQILIVYGIWPFYLANVYWIHDICFCLFVW